MKALEWVLSLIAAIILLQSLYFKFTAQPESIYIFTRVGMEPYGRIGSGIVELVAGVFLLLPRFRVYGAVLTLGVISGAIFFHLTTLGIEVQGDSGQLFYYALVVFFCALTILMLKRKELPLIGSRF